VKACEFSILVAEWLRIFGLGGRVFLVAD
jgi:hypothetical protein